MKLNGNLILNTDGSGVIENAFIEQVAGGVGGGSLPSGVKGRIVYNSDDNYYYFHNGTSWEQFASAAEAGVTSIVAGTGIGVNQATGAVTVTNDGVTSASGTANRITASASTGSVTFDIASTYVGQSSITTLGTITTGVWNGTAIGTAYETAAGSSGQIQFSDGTTFAADAGLSYVGSTTQTLTIGTTSTGGTIKTPDNGSGSSTNLTISTGTETSGGNGYGKIFIKPGANSGSASGPTMCNNTTVSGGDNTGSGHGGFLYLYGGGASTGSPGNIVITGGSVTNASNTSSGGAVNILGGTPMEGNGGSISITAASGITQTATAHDGGSITLRAGAGVSGGTGGSIILNNGSTTLYTFDPSGALLIAGTDAGTAGQVLTSGGTGAALTWTTPTTGTVTSVDATSNATALTVSGGPITTSGTFTFDLDADLKAVAALASTGFAVRTAADTWTTRTITGTSGRIDVTDGDGVSNDPTIDLSTVTNPGDGGTFVKITTDGYGRVTNSTAVVTSDITALVDSTYVNVAGDTMTGSLTMSTGTHITLTDAPTSGTDATNKNYVDAAVAGLEWKAAAKVATTTAGTLASDFANGSTVDGITLSTGDRILIKDQADQTENGIYTVNASGAPTRATDAATTAELNNATLFITDGTVNASTGWTQTTSDPVIGTSNIVFAQFSGSGAYVAGVGLDLTGNTFSVNLGAGIVQLPTDEVGIDLYDATNGALILTDDGSTRSTDAASQLYLLLDGSGGLAQTSSGLKINAASVTNAMLVNSTFTLNGGTGTDTIALGETLTFAGTPNRISSAITDNTVTYDIDANYAGQNTITTLGTVTTGTWNASVVGPTYGGTGFSSYAVGDLLYADTTTSLAKLADVATGNVLLSGGVSTAPSWGKVSLTTAVSGVLPVANGGTGASSLTNHGVLVGNGTGTVAVTSAGTDGTVLKGNTGGDPIFGAVDLTTDVTGVLPIASGGTNLNTVGATGTVLSTTDGSSISYNPIQYVHTFSSATSFTVTHNLGQKYVLVQVYDDTDNQIIPQSIVLNSTTQCTVTVNSAIAVTVVVMGIAGV